MENVDEISSELAPGGVERAARDGKVSVAGNADKVRIVMLVWKRSLKSVVRIKLDEACIVAMKAIWTQPMRLVAVCRRFLEYVGRKAGGKRFQLVTVCVRLKLLDLEKFFLKRVAFFDGSLMLLDEAKFRRLMFKQFLLDVKQGRVGFDAVRHAYGCLQALKKSLEGLCNMLRARDDLDWCHHLMPFVAVGMNAEIIAHC